MPSRMHRLVQSPTSLSICYNCHRWWQLFSIWVWASCYEFLLKWSTTQSKRTKILFELLCCWLQPNYTVTSLRLFCFYRFRKSDKIRWGFFFLEFFWKSILFPVSLPKPINSPWGSLRTFKFKIEDTWSYSILKRLWTRFCRTSYLRIQMKAIIMILLPQARLNIIFSPYQYDTNESSKRINKKTFFSKSFMKL